MIEDISVGNFRLSEQVHESHDISSVKLVRCEDGLYVGGGVSHFPPFLVDVPLLGECIWFGSQPTQSKMHFGIKT